MDTGETVNHCPVDTCYFAVTPAVCEQEFWLQNASKNPFGLTIVIRSCLCLVDCLCDPKGKTVYLDKSWMAKQNQEIHQWMNGNPVRTFPLPSVNRHAS